MTGNNEIWRLTLSTKKWDNITSIFFAQQEGSLTEVAKPHVRRIVGGEGLNVALLSNGTYILVFLLSFWYQIKPMLFGKPECYGNNSSTWNDWLMYLQRKMQLYVLKSAESSKILAVSCHCSFFLQLNF